MFLITGAAGFIGYSLARKLLEMGHDVVAVDCFSDYYSLDLKHARAAELLKFPKFQLYEHDLIDAQFTNKIIASRKWDSVIHLAAQPGVRYSITHPYAYTRNNIEVFLNVLEALSKLPEKPHFIYASSSSVYGKNTKQPYSEEDEVSQPNSLYAATKRMNELMAHTYHNLYGMDSIGLRFFTVYGPWGRPDMAPYLFSEALLEDREITLYDNGSLIRDFTYIDDIVNGIIGAIGYKPRAAELFNLGNHAPITVKHFLEVLEEICGKEAKIRSLPMQKGDVISTYADIEKASMAFGFSPSTDIKTGLTKFVSWLREYTKVKMEK